MSEARAATERNWSCAFQTAQYMCTQAAEHTHRYCIFRSSIQGRVTLARRLVALAVLLQGTARESDTCDPGDTMCDDILWPATFVT